MGMSRPRKSPDEKRSKKILLALTLAEHELVSEAAEASGLTVAAFVRFKLLDMLRGDG